MHNLVHIFENHELELMTYVLDAAKKNGFSAYTSPNLGDWKLSISGISRALALTLEGSSDLMVNCASDYPQALSEFSMVEALKHKERGVPLDMFLALMKHYRNAYIYVTREFSDSAYDLMKKMEAIDWITRAFDIIEVKIVSNWLESDEVGSRLSLERKVMDLINEKNRWVAIFESIPIPIVHINQALAFENMNLKAIEVLETIVMQFGGSGNEKSGASFFKRIQNIDFATLINYDFQDLIANDGKINDHVVTGFQVENHFCQYAIEIMKINDISNRFNGFLLLFTLLNEVIET